MTLAEVSGPSERTEVLPVLGGPGNPAVSPCCDEGGRLPDDLRELTTVDAALDALRYVVAKSDAAYRKDAAAAAWHAEPIVRFLCSAFGGSIAGARVSEDSPIVVKGILRRPTLHQTEAADVKAMLAGRPCVPRGRSVGRGAPRTCASHVVVAIRVVRRRP